MKLRYLIARVSCVLFLAGSIAPCAYSAESLPSLGDVTSEDLSPALERKLGEEVMRQAHEAGDILEDPETTEYLNEFGATLVAHAPSSPQPFEFFVVLDPSINAFALPGGYIGVHTGLIAATQSESELASVLGHEMGHVIQRHIARGLARSKEDSIVALAATVLGMLAMAGSKSSGGDAGAAAMTMGQSYAIQDQLAFGRDAEREADRVGFQILQDSGYDVAAMAEFFARLDQATRIADGGAPEWLRSHPMTSDRIADVQNRIRAYHYRQRPDSIAYQLVRTRVRVLQVVSNQELQDLKSLFSDQLRTGRYFSEAAIHYGLACIAFRERDYPGAKQEINRVASLVGRPVAMLANFQISLSLAEGNAAAAVGQAETARKVFPQSRMIVASYADALLHAARPADATKFLRDQIAMYRSEPKLYEMLAKSYAAERQPMLEHRYLAESYYLNGSVAGAVEQLRLAKAQPNGDFYEMSQVDARMRELQVQLEEIRKGERSGHKIGG